MGVWDVSYALEVVTIVLKCIFPSIQHCFLGSHFGFLFFSDIYFSRCVLISKLKLFFKRNSRQMCVAENIFPKPIWKILCLKLSFTEYEWPELKIKWKCYKIIYSLPVELLYVFSYKTCFPVNVDAGISSRLETTSALHYRELNKVMCHQHDKELGIWWKTSNLNDKRTWCQTNLPMYQCWNLLSR